MRRKAEAGFKPEVRDIYIKAFAWLDYMIDATGGFIRHFRNTGSEKKIANRFPVDGYDEASKRLFQFHGCYTHGHLCEATKNVKDAEWHASRRSVTSAPIKLRSLLKNRVSKWLKFGSVSSEIFVKLTRRCTVRLTNKDRLFSVNIKFPSPKNKYWMECAAECYSVRAGGYSRARAVADRTRESSCLIP